MNQCYIALGSNLETPLLQVNRAIDALSQLQQSTLVTASPWYRSAAIGPGEQPDYINGVAELHTALSAEDLLAALQNIENQQQRERLQRWGPRTLDLDILLYGNQTFRSKMLCIPHPRMFERNFVLYPLYDIAPKLVLPDGSKIGDYLNACPKLNLSLVTQRSSPTIAINAGSDTHNNISNGDNT